MLENVIEMALETAMSHEDMTAIIEANVENFKAENAWSFNEDEARAMTALTVAFFMQHHGEENPHLMYKILKESNFDFKGLYTPLNTVTDEEYLKFLTGEFKVVDVNDKVENKATNWTPAVEGAFEKDNIIALWYNEEFTYMYVDEVLDNGNLYCYSRKYGQIELSPLEHNLRIVSEGSLEEIVGQAEYLHSNGESIYLYNEGHEELLFSFIPVLKDGKLHILDKDTYTVSEHGYDSLIHLMKDVVTNVDGIEIIEVL